MCVGLVVLCCATTELAFDVSRFAKALPRLWSLDFLAMPAKGANGELDCSDEVCASVPMMLGPPLCEEIQELETQMRRCAQKAMLESPRSASPRNGFSSREKTRHKSKAISVALDSTAFELSRIEMLKYVEAGWGPTVSLELRVGCRGCAKVVKLGELDLVQLLADSDGETCHARFDFGNTEDEDPANGTVTAQRCAPLLFPPSAASLSNAQREAVAQLEGLDVALVLKRARCATAKGNTTPKSHAAQSEWTELDSLCETLARGDVQIER